MASVAKRKWTYKGEQREAWVVRYNDSGGRQRIKTFRHKKDANAYRLKVERELERGIHVAPSMSIGVRDTAEIWLCHCDERRKAGQGMRRSTLETYQYTVDCHIIPRFGALRLSELDAPTLQTWADEMLSGPPPLGAWRVRAILMCMGEILAHVQRRGLISHNVMREARPKVFSPRPKRVDIPSREDVRKMLEAAPDQGRVGMIVTIGALTGMQLGEIRGLAGPGVDFEAGEINIEQQANRWGELVEPKSAAGRRAVPMGGALSHHLKGWRLRSRPSPAEVVFCGRNGRALTPSYVRNGLWVPVHAPPRDGRGWAATLSFPRAAAFCGEHVH